MTAMRWLRERFPSVFGAPKPIIIMTPWGPVTESVRLQCAMKMRAEESVRYRVEKACIDLMGGDEEKGMAEARRRYPEGYED
jgi:hypothetical protein